MGVGPTEDMLRRRIIAFWQKLDFHKEALG